MLNFELWAWRYDLSKTPSISMQGYILMPTWHPTCILLLIRSMEKLKEVPMACIGLSINGRRIQNVDEPIILSVSKHDNPNRQWSDQCECRCIFWKGWCGMTHGWWYGIIATCPIPIQPRHPPLFPFISNQRLLLTNEPCSPFHRCCRTMIINDRILLMHLWT